MNTLYTIGHSDHVFGQFVSLLRLHGVGAVADVRSRPHSQRLPQFNRETMEGALKSENIHYVFLGEELGARRAEKDCYVDGRADYRRIAGTPAFHEGLKRVQQGLSKMRVALLCAEHDPLTCHRMILVTRHLRPACPEIQHILRDGTLEANHQTELRLIRELGSGNGMVTPAIIEQAYDFQGRRIAYSDDSQDCCATEKQAELNLI